VIDDHWAILKAISEHNSEKAKELTQKHLSRYKIDESAIRSRYPDYFK
ncbi:MAG TPA: GntR family transcriptional regulator, partial [Ruminococcaceae bacterium]|nr:GntR family transcriptional regulator [Oscillospiraceae bacterium]